MPICFSSMKRFEGVANVSERTIQLREDDRVARFQSGDESLALRALIEIDAATNACLYINFPA
jgi:hypothetical protein